MGSRSGAYGQAGQKSTVYLNLGVGNEVEHQGQDSMLAILNRMVEKIRSLDDRPVTYAMNPHFEERQDIDLSQIEDIQIFVDEEDEYKIYDNQERIRLITLCKVDGPRNR